MDLIDPEKEPMFEVSYNKPKEWSPTLENAIEAAATSFSGNTYMETHKFKQRT